MLTVPHYWQVKNTAFIKASSIHVILFQIRYHTSLSVPPLACPVEKRERERGGWTMEAASPFSLFVTNVTKENGLVKIFGQTDVSTGTGTIS